MKPSSFRMRAISVFSLEAGTSTLGWRAWIALRTRVSMSAMGSLVIKLLKGDGGRGQGPGEGSSLRSRLLNQDRAKRVLPPAPVPGPCPQFLHLPARLHHSGDLAVQCELPEAQPADAELAQIRTR